MVLYHLTNKKNVESILTNGIRPDIGENSRICGEEKQMVYLCQRKDILYWAIHLGISEIFRVNITPSEFDDIRKYRTWGGPVSEYLTPFEIPTENIEYLSTVRDMAGPAYKEAMRSVCGEYLYVMSRICQDYAVHYQLKETGQQVSSDRLLSITRGTVAIVERLDYSVLDMKEIIAILKDISNSGNNTYDDFYKDTDRRLYQMLMLYPSDETEPWRKKLYDVMTQKLQGTFHVDTGMWE
jgi:hypothetical protein